MRSGTLNAARQLALVALVVVLSACSFDSLFRASGTAGWQPGTTTHTIVVGALERSYLMHVPLHRPVSTAGTPRPYSLYVVLHGSAGDAQSIEHSSQMDSLSEVYHFLVAYPNGSQGAGGLFPSDWNAGSCCGAAARENIDDLSFMQALIAHIGQKLPVDQHRIYVAGFSDGGRMAYHVACKMASTIAAVGVVEGSLEDDSCAPTAPVPVIAVHGTSDPEVAYDDSALTPPPKPVPAAATDLPSSVQFWIAEDGCSTAATDQQSPHVVQTTFTACSGANVAFYTIEGGTHGWPGEPDGTGSVPPMSELNASQVMSQFFSQQRRK